MAEYNIETDYQGTIVPGSSQRNLSGTIIKNDNSDEIAVSFNKTTGEIDITGKSPEDTIIRVEIPYKKYKVTYNLTHVTASGKSGNNAAQYNSVYASTLTADEGYEISNVTVLVGSTDSTQYYNASTGVISIPKTKVTGNITVTASATSTQPEPEPVTYGNVTMTVINGTCQADSTTATSDYIATITPSAGYELTNPVISIPSDIDYEFTESTGVFKLNNSYTQNINVQITLQEIPVQPEPEPEPEPEPVETNENRGLIYISVINGKISHDKTVYTLKNTTQLNARIPVELEDNIFSPAYYVLEARDKDGNALGTLKDFDSRSNYYKRTGIKPGGYLNMGSGKGYIYFRRTGDIPYIELKNLKYPKDIYLTLTLYAERYLAMESPMGRKGHYYFREYNSFDALGMLMEPTIPVIHANYGEKQHVWRGGYWKYIPLGSIRDFSGITGSTRQEKLASLRSKMSFKFIKKAGLDGNNEVKYDNYNHIEQAAGTQVYETSQCPFRVEVDYTSIYDDEVRLVITCAKADHTQDLLSSTYTVANTNLSGQTFTYTEQHLKGSYHLSQLLAFFDNKVIFTTRLCREMYGVMNVYPEWYKNSGLNETILVTPSSAFQLIPRDQIMVTPVVPASKSDSISSAFYDMIDVHPIIKKMGTNTDLDLTLEYHRDGNTSTGDVGYGYTEYMFIKRDVTNATKYDLTLNFIPLTNDSICSDYPALMFKATNMGYDDLTISLI